MERWRELKKLRERAALLSDWYGEEFAATEMSDSAHSSQPVQLGTVLEGLLGEFENPDTGKFLKIESSWRKIAGTQLASFTHPAGFQDGVLILEVRHSALIAELTPSLDLIRDRINEVYGSGFCAEVRLTIGGGRSRRSPAR